MDFRNLFQRFVPLHWQRTRKGEPLSMVLLLRKPHLFKAEELRLAAQRAWNTPFTGSEENSKHCVVQSGSVTLMKAGPHLINFFHYPRSYVENHKENIGWLVQPSYREACIQHSACFGVNYMNDRVSVQLGFCVLSQLVAEMLDENCSGFYVPSQRPLIPHDGFLYLELQKFSSACDSGVVPRATAE